MTLYLKELITILEKEVKLNPNKKIKLGFQNPHSHSGDYSQLAFEPREDSYVSVMLSAAKKAIGSEYTGWKGGEYTMGLLSECFLAEEGRSGESITKRLLEYMLKDISTD